MTKAGSTDSEKLIAAMEGMHFQTPKGEMVFRPEDHQALQSMYAFKIKVDPNVKWAIPELVTEFTWKDMNIPDPQQEVNFTNAGAPGLGGACRGILHEA